MTPDVVPAPVSAVYNVPVANVAVLTVARATVVVPMTKSSLLTKVTPEAEYVPN